MIDIFKVINEYYHTFESFKGIFKIKSIWPTLLVVSTIAFISLFIFSIFGQSLFGLSHIQESYVFAFCLPVEIFWLYCNYKVKSVQDKLIVERCKKTLNILELKERWFQYHIPMNNASYLKFAEDLDKFLTLREKNKPFLHFTVQSLSNLFYTPDSKPRLLAMFMALAAATIALSISAGSTIDDIFNYFYEMSFLVFLKEILYISIVAGLGLLIIKFIYESFWINFEIFFDRLDGKKSISSRRVRIFIYELLRQYQIPKPKIRYYQDGKFEKLDLHS